MASSSQKVPVELTFQRVRGTLRRAGMRVLPFHSSAAIPGETGMQIESYAWKRPGAWWVYYDFGGPASTRNTPTVEQASQEHLDRAAAAFRDTGLHVEDGVDTQQRRRAIIVSAATPSPSGTSAGEEA